MCVFQLTNEGEFMLITDWLCAGVEGPTIDKREIIEQQISQMAATYNPVLYSARVWPEHIRGLVPDGLFKALGDVVEVKAERLKSGPLAGKLALYVKIAPLPELVEMVRNGQKVHLSVEIDPAFAHTNGAYLVGLGVTDSPASLGTSILKFSAASRPQNLFGNPLESVLQGALPSADAVDYSKHFAKLNSDNQVLHQEIGLLRQDFNRLLDRFSSFESLVSENNKELSETRKALENFSTGGFKPRRNYPSVPVDY